MDAKADTNIGPDLFQYYICSVANLLSRDDFRPSSGLVGTSSGTLKDKEDSTCNENKRLGSLFHNATGDGLSDFEKTGLKAMLRQSVVALTREVDEMLDPVFSMLWLRGRLAPAKSNASYGDANCKETGDRAPKRLKIPPSSSLINDPLNVSPVSCTLTEEGSPNERNVEMHGKSLTGCYNSECAKFSNPRVSKSVCADYPKQADNKDTNESFLGSSSRDGEVSDDLQVLLVNRGPLVDKKMEKHSAELSASLGRMEEKLEDLLDVVVSSCRPMSVAEKHELRGMIQNVAPKNLDRVVEIIQRKRPCEKRCDMSINLEHEDDLTLWRIYFYVTAVENATRLLML